MNQDQDLDRFHCGVLALKLRPFNPDNAVEFQHAEFRCLTGMVCQRLAGLETSQRLVKPCQRDAGIPGTGNCITALFGLKLALF